MTKTKHTHPHLINLFQSNEERREKYWLCRSLGANSYHAQRMRDWPLNKIERKYDLETKLYLYPSPDGSLQINSAIAV